jgi:hypothetical protein
MGCALFFQTFNRKPILIFKRKMVLYFSFLDFIVTESVLKWLLPNYIDMATIYINKSVIFHNKKNEIIVVRVFY